MSAPIVEIAFARDAGTAAQIAEHLRGCAPEFVARLRGRVDLDEFAAKIAAKAVRFEAWSGGRIAGLVAVYCNDRAGGRAFITHVGVLPEFGGRGVAAALLQRCVAHAGTCGMRSVELEVARDNARAIALYRGFGFESPATEHADLAMRLSLQPGGIP